MWKHKSSPWKIEGEQVINRLQTPQNILSKTLRCHLHSLLPLNKCTAFSSVCWSRKQEKYKIWMLFQSPSGAENSLADDARRNLKRSFIKIKETCPTFLGIHRKMVTPEGEIYSCCQAESPCATQPVEGLGLLCSLGKDLDLGSDSSHGGIRCRVDQEGLS